MDALVEQRMGGWVLVASAMGLLALGAWLTRSGSTRLLNGVDFSRIDPRDHPRVAAIVGQSVAAIGAAHLLLGVFLVAATAPVRQEWIVTIAVCVPVVGSLFAMHQRLQGLYRR